MLYNHVSAGNFHQQDLNSSNVTSNNSNNNIDPINNEIEELNDSFATQNISSHQTCDFLEERDQLLASILCNEELYNYKKWLAFATLIITCMKKHTLILVIYHLSMNLQVL